MADATTPSTFKFKASSLLADEKIRSFVQNAVFFVFGTFFLYLTYVFGVQVFTILLDYYRKVADVRKEEKRADMFANIGTSDADDDYEIAAIEDESTGGLYINNIISNKLGSINRTVQADSLKEAAFTKKRRDIQFEGKINENTLSEQYDNYEYDPAKQGAGFWRLFFSPQPKVVISSV